MFYLLLAWEALLTFLRTNGGSLFWIIAILGGGRLLLGFGARQIIRAADDGDDERQSGREKRSRTLAGLIRTSGNVVLSLMAIVMLLRLVGIDPMPILAGASVLGFGVGFGAQTLIKDLFAGIFIFAENQFAVGDRVKIGAFEGRVHHMSVRSTVLRDDEGHLVFLPNGSISSVVNLTLGKKQP